MSRVPQRDTNIFHSYHKSQNKKIREVFLTPTNAHLAHHLCVPRPCARAHIPMRVLVNDRARALTSYLARVNGLATAPRFRKASQI